MEKDCTICVAKTKMLFSCAVTAQLICAVTAQLICGFVFAYAKSRFSHDAARVKLDISLELLFSYDSIISIYLPKFTI